MTKSLTELSNQAVIYSDFNNNLTPHPVKKDITLLTNTDAVKRSVINLILTQFYSRPYQPKIGSGIQGLLFEQFTPVLQQTLRNSIIKCITNNEPRANLLDVTVSGNLDTGQISCSITFGINNSNQQPTTLNLPLTRIR